MSTCRFVAANQLRAVVGRHGDDCPGEELCRGCQPCLEDHCRIDGRTHLSGMNACAECLAETRQALHDIARMCGALPAEVEHRGIDSEAAMLFGPVADVEARQHAEASYLAGRLPEGWLEANHGTDCPTLRNEPCIGCAGDEWHPLTVLAGWQDLYAAEFDHEITHRATVEDAAGYLDRNLTYAASWPHASFEEFAHDLRKCATHLETVLHDGEQHDRGAPCMSCGAILEQPSTPARQCKHRTPARDWLKVLATYPELPVWNREYAAARAGCGACDQGGRQDGWHCPRCRESSTEDQYRFAVMHLHREEADRLTVRDMEIRTGVPASTIRRWASTTRRVTADGVVEVPPRLKTAGRAHEGGKLLYRVADVEALRDGDTTAQEESA